MKVKTQVETWQRRLKTYLAQLLRLHPLPNNPAPNSESITSFDTLFKVPATTLILIFFAYPTHHSLAG